MPADLLRLLEMIRTLRRRHLVNREEIDGHYCLTMHRSLQWSIIADLSRDYLQRFKVYQQAFTLLRHRLPFKSLNPTPEPNTRPKFEEISPQVLSLRTHCLWPEPPIELPPEFARILADVGVYLWQTGLWLDGRKALETAQGIINKQRVPAIDPLRRDVLTHLGVLDGMGGVSQRKIGLERREEALRIQRLIFKDTPFERLPYEEKVRTLKTECDVEDAVKLNQEVLDGRRTVCGEFSAFTLESYSTLGVLLYKAGRLEEPLRFPE